MEKNESKKFFNISKLFDDIGEEDMIWGVIEHVLERNGIEPKSGVEGLSVRYYDDENPKLDELGEIDET